MPTRDWQCGACCGTVRAIVPKLVQNGRFDLACTARVNLKKIADPPLFQCPQRNQLGKAFRAVSEQYV
eukprot:5761153-Amphidinium_carterae.1